MAKVELSDEFCGVVYQGYVMKAGDRDDMIDSCFSTWEEARQSIIEELSVLTAYEHKFVIRAFVGENSWANGVAYATARRDFSLKNHKLGKIVRLR